MYSYSPDRLRRRAARPGRSVLAAGLAAVLVAAFTVHDAVAVDAASRRPAAAGPGHRAQPASARPAETAAGLHGWGRPLSRWSDEFDYGFEADPAVPDRSEWRLAGGGPGECWPGHAGSGRRCDADSRVVGGILRMTGEADGDTGWLASPYGQRCGRWEARVRSRPTAPDNGKQYQPLLILWPDSEEHPQDGEYDYLENGAPGERCAEAYLRYPPPEQTPVQQEFARKCGVGLSRWHNVAVEWSPTPCADSSTARSGSASPEARTKSGTASSALRPCTRPCSSTTSTATACRAPCLRSGLGPRLRPAGPGAAGADPGGGERSGSLPPDVTAGRKTRNSQEAATLSRAQTVGEPGGRCPVAGTGRARPRARSPGRLVRRPGAGDVQRDVLGGRWHRRRRWTSGRPPGGAAQAGAAPRLERTRPRHTRIRPCVTLTPARLRRTGPAGSRRPAAE